MERLGDTECMGPMLQAEIEHQLLEDLLHYNVNTENVFFDWSDTSIEGHRTSYLDGEIENWSGISVIDSSGQVIAEGWMEFIHGGGDNPLFVFWDYLIIYENGVKRDAKTKSGIPRHIWEKIPDTSKQLCAKAGSYDSNWSDDPLVKQWARNHAI
jgi:hypothetical protein